MWVDAPLAFGAAAVALPRTTRVRASFRHAQHLAPRREDLQRPCALLESTAAAACAAAADPLLHTGIFIVVVAVVVGIAFNAEEAMRPAAAASACVCTHAHHC